MSRCKSIAAILASLILVFASGALGKALYQEESTAVHPPAKSAQLGTGASDIFVPPKDYKVLRTTEIGATATNYGTFGTGYVGSPICDGEECPSFMSPDYSGFEYLFSGAVWIGAIVGSDTLVSVGADGWFQIMEMIPPVPSDTFFGVSDYSVWTLFTDTITDPSYVGIDPFDNREHIPINVRIANRAHSWTSYSENQMIIYDMVITNVGDYVIQDGYMGLHFDGDVYHVSNSSSGFQDDVTGALRDDGIAYIIDNDGDPETGSFTSFSPLRLFAFKPLLGSFSVTDTNFNWWISNGNAALDFGPRLAGTEEDPFRPFNGHLGTPTGDRNKYYVLSHPEFDYDQVRTFQSHTDDGWLPPPPPGMAIDFADGYDTKFLMSFGPFSLLPDSSARIIFTTFTGEAVHQIPDNMTNIPDDPDAYLANLNFTSVLSNAAIADSIANELSDPLNPAMGLYVLHDSPDSVVLEWDPWVFSEVEGYEIFVYELPDDSMPYPGVAPPWISPTTLDFVASVDQVYQYSLTGLEAYDIYLAAVANRTTARAIGAFSEPVLVQPGGRPPAPVVSNEYIFIRPGDPAVLTWSPPDGITVDHYNIYKFAGPDEAEAKFHPFYDNGQFSATTAPRDSFFVDGNWYYYYAMEPYHRVNASITTFTEYADDSVVYVVTAVVQSGVESAFSEDVIVLEAAPQTKDIIVLACGTTSGFVHCDSIASYYDDVLSGYDYDIYNWIDTIRFVGCPSDLWYDLMRYRMVIIDGGWRTDVLNDMSPAFCGSLRYFEKYVWSGGVLVYFGSFPEFTNLYQGDPPDYYPAMHDFLINGFGVDSVFQTSAAYYSPDPSIFKDTLGGFIRAEHIDKSFFDLEFDSTANPYVFKFWPDSVGPMASAFVPNEHASPIYTYRSLYPGTSIAEGRPVGIVSEMYPSPIFSFGFRPWYMKKTGFVNLIDALVSVAGESVYGSAIIEPDTMYFLWAYALDPDDATVYVGGFSGIYSPGMVDPSTVRINGGVAPTDVTVIGSHPEFSGQVLAMTVPIPDFLLSYGPLWGRTVHPFVVSATMTDGAVLSAHGDVFIKGLLRGDINSDGNVNVGDVAFLVDYLYRSGRPPVAATSADVNGDCSIDLADILYVINYLFRNGPDFLPACVQ